MVFSPSQLKSFEERAGQEEGDGDGDVQLGGEGFGDETPFGAEEKKKGIKGGTLLLLGVVGLAAVGLYSMRTLGTAAAGQADNALEATVEEFLTKLGGGDPDAADEAAEAEFLPAEGAAVVEALVGDRTQRQVPLDDVKKNPFVLFEGAKPEATAEDADRAAAELAEAREKALETARRDAGRLRVLMVMGGGTPMANINGTIYQEGDVVEDERSPSTFLVQDITEAGVILLAEDPAIGFRQELLLPLVRPN